MLFLRLLVVGRRHQNDIPAPRSPLTANSSLRAPQAEELGLGLSLFKRLAEANPSAISRLRLQYRMAEPIMAVCNELVYGGQLRCGNTAVAEGTLELARPERLPTPRDDPRLWAAATAWEATQTGEPGDLMAGAIGLSESVARGLGRQSRWLHAALAPQHKVVVLNTDVVPAPEEHAAEGARAQ